MPTLCRDCLLTAGTGFPAGCPRCGGHRIVSHPALLTLTIAHTDCDAFYASAEKRDRPQLASKPVIVGGGRRGVVAASCYVARTYGMRSTMPMFKALKACPDAIVIKPDFSKYTATSRQIRRLMAELTPLVQPLSIDEAVLDLRGTEALHGAPAPHPGPLRPGDRSARKQRSTPIWRRCRIWTGIFGACQKSWRVD
jgi:DNA polymerase-4